ncbi:SREBP regulating gene protein isoform 4-T4 [Megaptera novaeangliae]
MVNLAAMVWRRLLRKRWVLALVFGLSLVYFLTSTFKQEERAVRDRNLLQVQDHDQPIPWKVQFNLGNSSRPSNQCRNSIQGKHLITDELGYVCERKDLLVNGCCNVNVPGTKQYCCDGCLSNGCCSAYEYCVSCCLQPNKQLLLERFLNRAAVAFQNLFMAVEDHFELCLAKCRTSSQGSVLVSSAPVEMTGLLSRGTVGASGKSSAGRPPPLLSWKPHLKAIPQWRYISQLTAMPKQTDSYCPCCSPPSAKGQGFTYHSSPESEDFCMTGVSNHLQILLTKHKAAPGGWVVPWSSWAIGCRAPADTKIQRCEFPGGLVVRTLRFQCRGPGSIPVWGTEIPQAVRCGQKKQTGLPWWRSG